MWKEEIQAIVNKYPEISKIKVELVSEVPFFKGSTTILGNQVLMPNVPNIVPNLNTGFEMTETRLDSAPSVGYQPRPTQKKAEDKNQLAQTLDALKIPKI